MIVLGHLLFAYNVWKTLYTTPAESVAKAAKAAEVKA
jgi:cbb3-type cytochrome oxidase subunit 1